MNIIIGHSNTDLDCLASMIVAKKLYPAYQMVLSSILNPLANSVVEFYISKLDFIRSTDLKDKSIENIIVVDTRSTARIKEVLSVIGPISGKIKVIDHHPSDGCDIPDADITYKANGANVSTLILMLMEKGLTLDSDEATIALTGIYADTLNFTNDTVTAEDFQAASYLIAQGASMKLARFFLQPLKQDYQISYFHALLNAIDFHVVKGHEIIVSSMELSGKVNGLAAIVERVFSVEKADAIFSMFYFPADDSTAVIARSRKDTVKVNEIMAIWGGGGHEKAASANIKKTGSMNVPLMLKEALQKLTPERTAANIMTKNVKSIPVDVTIAKAKEYLVEINHTAAPVIDSDGKVVGMMGNKNIVNAEKANCLNSTVPSYMNKKVITLKQNDTMRDIERVFLENKFNHIPVVDDRYYLVGILTRKDFLRAIHNEGEIDEIFQTR